MKAKTVPAARARHKKVLKLAKGYRGARNRQYKKAQESVLKAGAYAYRDRRNKKREMRRLWIVRINAALRAEGKTYSVFMSACKRAGVELDRKVLSELAVKDGATFSKIVSELMK